MNHTATSSHGNAPKRALSDLEWNILTAIQQLQTDPDPITAVRLGRRARVYYRTAIEAVWRLEGLGLVTRNGQGHGSYATLRPVPGMVATWQP